MNRRSFIKTALAGLAGLAATKLPKAEAEGVITPSWSSINWGPSLEFISLPDGAKLTATTAIEPGSFVVMDDSGGCSGGTFSPQPLDDERDYIVTYTDLAWEVE